MTRKITSPLGIWSSNLILVFILFLLAFDTEANENAHVMPEGTLGWWFYSGNILDPSKYTNDQADACKQTAKNHLGTDLINMYAIDTQTPKYHCVYKNPVGGAIFYYGSTKLVCASGYEPRWPGSCVKKSEVTRQVSCSPTEVNYARGNPVVISSGAKVQTENDIRAASNGALNVDRTYRTLRDTGVAQSAGSGWSFSFDRAFKVTTSSSRKFPTKIVIVRGDGSYYEFSNSGDDKKFNSRFDKRERLQNLDDRFTDWLLVTKDGEIDRFQKIGNDFLLKSTHNLSGRVTFYEYDSDNQLKHITDQFGRSVQIMWKSNVVSSVKSDNEEVLYQYDYSNRDDGTPITGTERLISVSSFDMAGILTGVRRYHYEDNRQRHYLTGITDENGVRFAKYAYNDFGQTILSEHAGGVNRYTFAYPSENKRVIIDPVGTAREVELSYQGSDFPGKIVSTNQPAGTGCEPASTKFTYDRSGNVSSKTDFNDNKTCLINDNQRGLQTSRIEGLKGAQSCPISEDSKIPTGTRRITTKWHNEWNVPIAVAEPNQISRYVFNGQVGNEGKTTTCIDNSPTFPNGIPFAVICEKTIETTADNNGATGFGARIEGAARTWRYQYDEHGRLTRAVGPTSATGQPESVEHEYHGATTATYSKGDLAFTRTTGAGTTSFLEYTRNGLPVRILHPNGIERITKYGSKGRLASITLQSPEGASETISYSYDKNGQLLQIVEANGVRTTYEYDDAHRLTAQIDHVGNRINLSRDPMGNTTRVQTRSNSGEIVYEQIYSFDALGRLQNSQRGRQIVFSSHEYDAGGNSKLTMDALGRTTTRQFDSFDRLVLERFPGTTKGHETPENRFTYNFLDDIVSFSDPRGLTTYYERDGYGQLTQLRSPDTNTTKFHVDGAGKLTASQDARGVITNLDYDKEGRIRRVGSLDIQYGLAGTGADGHLASAENDSAQINFNYDSFGRITKKTQIGLEGDFRHFSVAYVHGENGASKGKVKLITYPSGNRVSMTYGEDGLVTGIQLYDHASSTEQAIISEVVYRPFGDAYQWKWASNNASDAQDYVRTFDQFGRLSSYPLGDPKQLGNVRTLTYDNADQIRSFTHNGQHDSAGLDQIFSYDDSKRLIGVRSSSINQQYSYDSSGNRTSITYSSKTYKNLISSSSNRLTQTNGPGPFKNYKYDTTGNLLSDGISQYSYNANGRLETVNSYGELTRYRYNALGERISKEKNGKIVTYYFFDVSGNLIGEYDSTGKAIQEIIYLDNLPIAISMPAIENGKTISKIYNIYTDHLGTPRVISRASDGKSVWRWDVSDPFGAQQPNEQPDKLPRFVYNGRFPGQIFDEESNNHYNFFRDYDPQTGRYMQSDPIGLQGGVNTYIYVEGDPVSNSDPSGLNPAWPVTRAGRMGWWFGNLINPIVQPAIARSLDLAFPHDMPLEARQPVIKVSREQARRRKEYTSLCKTPVPPSGDRCKDAKANRDRLKMCFDLRVSYGKDYHNDGHHDPENLNTKRAFEKLEEWINKNCKDDCHL